ncbi:hypothetical protein [Streptomyces sp. NPDC046887]|uniref:hypothetical protein n=1 Tax=Streptomyces sp. NPDC046887 TaxID=3155472 RepID=UPI0033DB912F
MDAGMSRTLGWRLFRQRSRYGEAACGGGGVRLGRVAGHRVCDGRDGYRPGAPSGRIVCTYIVREVPAGWVEQCPGGRIVTPWGSSFHSGRSPCWMWWTAVRGAGSPVARRLCGTGSAGW